MALPGRMADAAAGRLEAERLLALLPAGGAAQHIIEFLGRVIMGRVEALRRLDIEPEAQRIRSRKAIRPDDLVIGGTAGEARRHLGAADDPGNLGRRGAQRWGEIVRWQGIERCRQPSRRGLVLSRGETEGSARGAQGIGEGDRPVIPRRRIGIGGGQDQLREIAAQRFDQVHARLSLRQPGPFAKGL